MWKIVFNTSWYETWSPIHINSTRYECVRLCLCSIGTENVNLHNINKFTFICFRMFRGWRAKKSLCIWLGLGKTRKYLPLVHSFYFACSPPHPPSKHTHATHPPTPFSPTLRPLTYLCTRTRVILAPAWPWHKCFSRILIWRLVSGG